MKTELAAQMRREPTPAERALHQAACRFLPSGRWKAQRLLCGYIPDVVSKDLRIVLEADGSVHFSEEAKQRDAFRDAVLMKAGYTVLRFLNERVLNFPRCVAASLAETVKPRNKEIARQHLRLTQALADPTWNGVKIPPMNEDVAKVVWPRKPTRQEVAESVQRAKRRREIHVEALEEIVKRGCPECAEIAAQALRYKGKVRS